MQRPVHIKAVMTGNSGVGKSSILLRFSNDEFDQFNQPTLGAAFVSKTLPLGEKEMKFQVWDTAGQQKYEAIAPIYYRQSEIAICVYDMTDRKSFENLSRWINLIQENGNGIKMLTIVGNKADKADFQQITYSEGKQFAQKHNALFKITSAKDGKGINDLFISIAKAYMQNQTTKEIENGNKVKIQNSDSPNPEHANDKKRKRKRDYCCPQG